MPQHKKKKTREELLEQKRKNERKRYERIKNGNGVSFLDVFLLTTLCFLDFMLDEPTL